MAFELEIYYLNNEHSSIVNDYIDEVYQLVHEATFFTEDYKNFEDLIQNVVSYHNGLGEYVADGSVDRREWYTSLPNNLYWVSKGFFSNLPQYQDKDIVEHEQKLLYLTIDVLDRLNDCMEKLPLTQVEMNINLN